MQRKAKGRARTRPEEVAADSAYDAEEIREYLRLRGIKSNIPRNEKGDKPEGGETDKV